MGNPQVSTIVREKEEETNEVIESAILPVEPKTLEPAVEPKTPEPAVEVETSPPPKKKKKFGLRKRAPKPSTSTPTAEKFKHFKKGVADMITVQIGDHPWTGKPCLQISQYDQTVFIEVDHVKDLLVPMVFYAMEIVRLEKS
jgi:hypothetical protein